MNEYLNDIALGFCPFLRPAIDKGLCKFVTYDIASHSLEGAQEFLFCAGLVHTDHMRATRRDLGKLSYLYCENVILATSDQVSKVGKDLFAWPHWCLKTLYTKSSVLYGKFWIGEKDNSKDGRPIPEPVQHFLSVRSAIKAKDARFFEKAVELKNDFEQGEDTGEDPLADILEPAQHEKVRAVLDRPAGGFGQLRSKIDELVEMRVYPLILEAVRQRHNRFQGETTCKIA
jgi:hypothetical protein